MQTKQRFILVLSILTALLILGSVSSCSSKKVTTQSTSVSDTLINKSFKYISRPISTNYEIGIECDSIGNVKPISQKQTSGSNQVNLSILNNKLQAKLYTGVSKIKVDTLYKTKYKTKVETSEVVKYRTPFWHWLAHLIALIAVVVLLYIQFGSPVSWIQKLLRIFTK